MNTFSSQATTPHFMKSHSPFVSAFVLFLVMTLSSISLQAKIWIVNNNGVGDFTSFDAAVTGMAAGDTLYLVPSTTAYTIATSIAKRVHVFGVGYWLAENNILGSGIAGQNAILNASNVNELIAGSEGSSFEGVQFGATTFNVHADNVTFKRCRFDNTNVYGRSSSDFTKNISFVQCWLGAVIWFESPLFSNSYVYNPELVRSATFDQCVINRFSPEIQGMDVQNSTITNSIILGNISTEVTNSASNNIFSYTIVVTNNTAVTGTGVQRNVAANTVTTVANSNDALYILPTSSPAIAAGSSGQNIGMFGGTSPYRLSGVPSIPLMTKFDSDAVVSKESGVNISITFQGKN